MAKVTSCFYCSLPITGASITLKVGEEDATFCCRGCSLVYQLLGRGGEQGQSALVLARLVTGVVFGMVVMLISWSDYLTLLVGGEAAAQARPDFFLHRVYLPLAATAVMLVLGVPIARGAWRGLRELPMGIDLLISVGMAAAYATSLYSTITGQGRTFYDTATMILVLVTLGRLLESRGKAQAAAHLRSLFDLNPKEATLIVPRADETGAGNQRGGPYEATEERRVPVADLRVGDRIRVRPGEAFAVDGLIVEGAGGVDESVLTGEAMPAYRGAGQRVMSGTHAVDGAFLVVAERVGDETTVSRLSRLLEAAKASKLPIVRLADRMAGVAIPLVLAVALASGAYWTWAQGFERGLMVGLSVLLIACPCALGLAAPLAIWMGLAAAASRGVIIRSAGVLEDLSHVGEVFFDKTGTLTTGTLAVSGIAIDISASVDESSVVGAAAALEVLSLHPAGKAIYQHAVERGVKVADARDFSARAGLGVRGVVDGRLVHLGSRRFLEDAGLAVCASLSDMEMERGRRGEVVVFIGWEGSARGAFALEATARREAIETVAALRKLGVSAGILSGDGRGATEVLGKRLAVDDVRWGLLPDQKLEALRRVRGAGARRGVAMVGDGINDAPALAAADVGIALGSGADLAREAAEVTIYGSAIDRVPWAISLARSVRRTIAGNLFWACCYNVLGVGLAAAGLLTPVMAAGAMVLSSVCVIANSSRLRDWALVEAVNEPAPGQGSASASVRGQATAIELESKA